MYWPIGAPRIYAASSLNLGRRNDEIGENNATPVELSVSNDSNGQEEQLSTEANASRKEAGESTSSKPRKGTRRPTLLKNTSLGKTQEDLVGGEIVGMRLSRSGHIFATITASTLSIWQTKVSLLNIIMLPRSNLFKANFRRSLSCEINLFHEIIR
jgi:RAB6A-GEF complex partner protein 1